MASLAPVWLPPHRGERGQLAILPDRDVLQEPLPLTSLAKRNPVTDREATKRPWVRHGRSQQPPSAPKRHGPTAASASP